MASLRLLLLAILCASCGGSSKPAATPAPAPHPCEAIADNVARLMDLDRDETFRECVDAEMTEAEQRCFRDAKTVEEIGRCEEGSGS